MYKWKKCFNQAWDKRIHAYLWLDCWAQGQSMKTGKKARGRANLIPA